uniref:Uncharacterized protein n=1 Tax=Kalanchoe fedtschenkoi TaxID=63787 RepID=A0A7N0U4B8_KALFE
MASNKRLLISGFHHMGPFASSANLRTESDLRNQQGGGVYSHSSKRFSTLSQLGRSFGSAQQSAIILPKGPSGISSLDPSLATAYTTWITKQMSIGFKT